MLDEIQVTVIDCRGIRVAVSLEWRVKRVICKTWTGSFANNADPDQNQQNTVSDKGLHSLLNYRNSNIK